MNISKDESIITQVAAKIAAEIATSIHPENVDVALADWAIAFETVREGIMAAHGASAAPAPAAVPNHLGDPTALIQEVFPSAEPAPAPTQSATNMTVQVKGTQHGVIPDWLVAQASAAGCTAVWDNRDGLAQNPKRPWFKAADGTKNPRNGQDLAFWPPR